MKLKSAGSAALGIVALCSFKLPSADPFGATDIRGAVPLALSEMQGGRRNFIASVLDRIPEIKPGKIVQIGSGDQASLMSEPKISIEIDSVPTGVYPYLKVVGYPASGKVWVVQENATLNQGSWNDIATITSNGTVTVQAGYEFFVYSDPPPPKTVVSKTSPETSDQHFYRLAERAAAP